MSKDFPHANGKGFVILHLLRKIINNIFFGFFSPFLSFDQNYVHRNVAHVSKS